MGENCSQQLWPWNCWITWITCCKCMVQQLLWWWMHESQEQLIGHNLCNYGIRCPSESNICGLQRGAICENTCHGTVSVQSGMRLKLEFHLPIKLPSWRPIQHRNQDMCHVIGLQEFHYLRKLTSYTFSGNTVKQAMFYTVLLPAEMTSIIFKLCEMGTSLHCNDQCVTDARPQCSSNGQRFPSSFGEVLHPSSACARGPLPRSRAMFAATMRSRTSIPVVAPTPCRRSTMSLPR